MIALALAALVLGPRQLPAQALLLFDHGGKFALERRALEEGKELVLESSAATGLVDVVLPVGPGRAGSVEALGTKRTIRLRAERGVLHASTEVEGGPSFARPERSLAELAHETLYLCVRGAQGRRAAFLVHGAEAIEELGEGPFLDLFAGRVPLGEHDCSVTTDVQPALAAPSWTGEAALSLEGWIFVEAELPGGKRATMALDLGAGTTLLAQSVLPEGTAVEAATIARYQGGKRVDERYTTGGATGTIGGLKGRAKLASLKLGSAELHEAEVDVLDALPELGGRRVDGILGLDLLRRAGRLQFDFERRRLVLGAAALADPQDSVRCLELGSHLFVPARAGKLSWQWLVDSGAPRTILDARSLEAAGIESTGTSGAAGGLEGPKLALLELAPCAAKLAQHVFTDARLLASDLDVFRPLRTEGQGVGLLGNDLMQSLGTLEIDLLAGRMSWKRTSASARR